MSHFCVSSVFSQRCGPLSCPAADEMLLDKRTYSLFNSKSTPYRSPLNLTVDFRISVASLSSLALLSAIVSVLYDSASHRVLTLSTSFFSLWLAIFTCNRWQLVIAYFFAPSFWNRPNLVFATFNYIQANPLSYCQISEVLVFRSFCD